MGPIQGGESTGEAWLAPLVFILLSQQANGLSPLVLAPEIDLVRQTIHTRNMTTIRRLRFSNCDILAEIQQSFVSIQQLQVRVSACNFVSTTWLLAFINFSKCAGAVCLFMVPWFSANMQRPI